MRSAMTIGLCVLVLGMLGLLGPRPTLASTPGCGQAQVETLLGAPSPPGPSRHYIYPRQDITPFYQWESNNGYCGETSLIIGGLVNGQWMSQFNARLVCGAFFGPEANRSGASLLQAGSPLRTDPNYNAQLLIEEPDTGVSGPYDFAHASLCAANSRLVAETYPYTTGYKHKNVGIEGYRDYMRWIKAQLIAGNQVTVAVYFNGGTDAQYDHEVSVLKIGTNHSPADDNYYGDDVLYFDDHGAYSAWRTNPWDDNSDPPAGNNYETPYIGGVVGTCNGGECVSNAQPPAMLMTLEITVSGLRKGVAYNVYEYELPSLTGADTGASARLAVPTQNFNANAQAANAVVRFVATGPTYVSPPVALDSTRIAVFRAVPASAP